MGLHQRLPVKKTLTLDPKLMESSLSPDLKAAVALVEAGLATRVVLVGFPAPPELCEPPYRLILSNVQIEFRFTPFPEEPIELVVSKYEPVAVAATSEIPVKLYERLAS
jgi:hypothetical protein